MRSNKHIVPIYKGQTCKTVCENRCTTSITTHNCIYLDKQMYICISNCKPISISITHHDLGKAGVFSKRNIVVWVQYTGTVWYGIYLHTIISKHHCIRSMHLSGIFFFIVSIISMHCSKKLRCPTIKTKENNVCICNLVHLHCSSTHNHF